MPIKAEYREKAQLAVSLIGGDKISSTGGNFSLGICGTYNGVAAFFTCGHGINKVGDAVNSSSGLKIGETVVRQYTNGSYYDYAIVKITDTANFSTTNKVYGSGGATVSITGVSTYPVEGTTVYKYGYSGLYGYGGVSSTETSVSYSGTVIWGLTKANLTSGSVVAGDSGGPCYFSNKISGVVSGSAGSTNLYFSPMLTGSFQAKTS
ncbi:MAG: S1 family peptidase [Clostridiales bacterium]|nr:S1 family peptidase [Clostridiales bacterium]